MSTKQERALYVQKTLARLYPKPKAPLTHHDHYTLLVAVMLSAQTTDALVNKITPELFKKAGTPEKMAKLSETEILSLIKSVNYAPTKARHLKKMAQILIEKFHSIVPHTFLELESLPGVGHKTASVILSECFKIPAFPVDTHIHRLAKRWKLSDGSTVEKTEKDLKKIFPESHWHDLHLQIIFYGREHCTARGCDGKTCMICKDLNYF